MIGSSKIRIFLHLMCPHSYVTNLPQPKQKHPGKKKLCPLLRWKEVLTVAYDLFKKWSELSLVNRRSKTTRDVGECSMQKVCL